MSNDFKGNLKIQKKYVRRIYLECIEKISNMNESFINETEILKNNTGNETTQ